MKAGGPDLPPLGKLQVLQVYLQIYAAVRISNYEYRIGNFTFKVVH